MPRYCVNAAVTSDAWTYLEADDLEAATEQASTLSPREFELGDPFAVELGSVEADA